MRARVLIGEVHPDTVAFLRQSIEDAGYIASTARSGDEAIYVLRSSEPVPDAVVTPTDS
jgi:DNA-binding response OmpR family regulator